MDTRMTQFEEQRALDFLLSKVLFSEIHTYVNTTIYTLTREIKQTEIEKELADGGDGEQKVKCRHRRVCDILKFPLSANLCRWHVEMDRPAPLGRSWE